ncbi:uncharacterized protein N7506_004575 [Penicillium brevicompactum]|uniref:SH3 domain-containing protein n=1 Tax=Penicillium brevicompactum TaxID=5074 RepID=A0A9W9UFL9_PENBR|nr:uncharacterized protein N7506_004575 [Penicillium brevicompactum]KAJ5334888.1 hypothetical protein N7452_007291 [Penicillium brevicompactum]KAJ5336553.1 hypothetical protein N7506_004575 [Penicillium brevicompactum]
MATPSKLELAMRTRSLRAIQTELEFLDSVGLITPAQMNSILPPLKAIADTHATEAERVSSPATRQLAQPEPVHPVPAQNQPPAPYAPSYSPPASQMSNMSMNEKAGQRNQYASPPPQAPPAYPQVPPVKMATALYQYRTQDPGDLSFEPQHRIEVTTELNNDWWRGRNQTTGQEGIFPSSYVAVESEKAAPYQAPPPTNYGNMPLQVSQGGQPSNPANPEDPKQNKLEEGGKKFGKKLGNAAIFGAGATMGSNIVNSIF